MIGALTSSFGTLSVGTASGLRPRESGSAFAADIMRRAGLADANLAPVQPVKPVTGGKTGVLPLEGGDPVQGATAPSAPVSQSAADAAAHSANGKDLEAALSQTVSFMADTFGDKAASAMMGLVYKRIGEGQVTEENLGQAMLDVVKFVDTNFGTDKGDELIKHLNGTLNDSLNAYFDNGSNEEFLGVTIAPSGGVSVNGTQLVATPSSSQNMGDAISSLLEQYADLRSAQNPMMGKGKKKPGYPGIMDNQDATGILVDVAA